VIEIDQQFDVLRSSLEQGPDNRSEQEGEGVDKLSFREVALEFVPGR
jgi:hypothetical protein